MAESDFSSLLRSRFQGGRPSPDDHPSPEELVAYRGETLDPDDREAIRAHLLVCAECAELLLELAALEQSPGAASEELSEVELETAWRKQRQRLFPRRLPSLSLVGGWAAAACLALLAGALALEVRDLRRTTAELFNLDLPRVIAKEGGERDPGTAELPLLELEKGKPGIVLLLLPNDLPFTSYRAELFSVDSTPVETAPVLVRDGLSAAEKLLLIQVTTDLLPAGEIRVVVFGRRQDRYEKIEEYGLRVRHL